MKIVLLIFFASCLLCAARIDTTSPFSFTNSSGILLANCHVIKVHIATRDSLGLTK